MALSLCVAKLSSPSIKLRRRIYRRKNFRNQKQIIQVKKQTMSQNAEEETGSWDPWFIAKDNVI